MIDKNSLPYIDLGADAETLRRYAKDNFGKLISSQAKEDTVKDRFAAIYEEETGVKLVPVESLDDDLDLDDKNEEEPAEVKVKVAKPAKTEKPVPTGATIIVQDDPTDPQPITGGYNFTSFRIIRNVPVRVNMGVLNALRDAVETRYDPKTLEKKDVIAYPFSVVEYHFD